MVNHVIGTRDPDPLPPGSERPGIKVHDVNLVGEYNIAGEFWHVLPLLDEMGLRVLCTLSGDARFREVQTMHKAEVNMMVCSKAMVNVARRLQKQYGTPWFEGSFYGITDTSQALRDFARMINDPDLIARTEAIIAREEARIREALEPWKQRLKGKRVLLFTGGVKSWSVISALQDLGMVVVATGTKKSTEEDKARIRELMGEDTLMIEDGSPKALLQVVQGLQSRYSDRRRPEYVYRFESANPVPGYQSGTRIRLRRLSGHAGIGAATGFDDRKSGLVGGPGSGAMAGWKAKSSRA